MNISCFRRSFLAAALALTAFASAQPANGALVIYTDRAAFLAALPGAATIETFNSLADGLAVTPATVFPSGIVVTPSVANTTNISSFAFSSIGQGNGLSMIVDNTFTLPSPVVAFGFDYEDLESDINLVVGGSSFLMARTGDADTGITPDDFGFIGVIAGSASEIPGGAFTIDFGSPEGVSMDNLTFVPASAVTSAVPEPSTLALAGFGSLGLLGYLRRKRA